MIKFLVMDVDGTLTDGKLYYGNNGEVFKAFNVKDGCGLKDILPQYNIVPIIITARKSDILINRCNELGIDYLFQGERDKLSKLLEIIDEYNSINNSTFSLKNCAYIGDDVLDLKCMLEIKKSGGIVACPQDASDCLLPYTNYLCKSKASEGAVREFIDWLVQDINKLHLEKVDYKVEKALRYLLGLDYKDIIKDKNYYVDEEFFFFVREYYTKEEEKCILESHREYIDIQVIVEGQELIKLADSRWLTCKSEYDDKADITIWNPRNSMTEVLLKKGSYVVLYPYDAHMVGVQYEKCNRVVKIVGKLKV